MKEKNQYRVNHNIRVPNVRLVGDNVTIGVYTTNEAIKLAESMELDLIEVSPNANPPVCKIIDYGKFLYEMKKREKEQKKKQKESLIETKEIRMTPNIEQHDIEYKTRHAIEFLKDNNKVKFVVMFSGREIVHSDRGQVVLLNIADKLIEYGIPEALPKIEGKRMSMIVKPVKK